jgi:hypothetical protein
VYRRKIPLLPPILIVLIIGSLSIGIQKGVYKNNPTENWMGPVNTVLFITAILATGVLGLGYLFLGNYAILLVFAGWLWVVCLFIGIILTSALSPVRKAFYYNALLYYLPTVISIIVTIYYIANLRN